MKTARIIPFPARKPQDKTEAKRKLRERLERSIDILDFDDIA